MKKLMKSDLNSTDTIPKLQFSLLPSDVGLWNRAHAAQGGKKRERPLFFGARILTSFALLFRHSARKRENAKKSLGAHLC
jgi:hypothetical protein